MSMWGRALGLRRKSTGEVFMEWLISMVVGTFLGGFDLMLAVGVIHAEWLRSLPTLGYWWATLIVFLLKGTFSRMPKIERYDESKRS